MRMFRRQFSLFGLMGAVCVIAVAFAAMRLVIQSREIKKQRHTLGAVGWAYHASLGDTGHLPREMADMSFLWAEWPEAAQALKDGEVVVLWNAEVRGSDNSKYILGWHKDVPAKGGLVLMADGVVKHMTAGEFNAGPKAKSVSAQP